MAINKTKWGALACGLCCALCVALRGEVDAARAEALERYGGDQVEVCVAKRDLAAGEVVDASAVVTKMWVADLLPDTAVTDSSQIIGRRLGSNVIKGEVLCFRRTEVSDSELAVPAGMAAISVPARPVQAVGGSVEPGMKWTCTPRALCPRPSWWAALWCWPRALRPNRGRRRSGLRWPSSPSGFRRSWRRRRTWNFISRCRPWVAARHRTVRREGRCAKRRLRGRRRQSRRLRRRRLWRAPPPSASGQPAAPENGATGEGANL